MLNRIDMDYYNYGFAGAVTHKIIPLWINSVNITDCHEYVTLF